MSEKFFLSLSPEVPEESKKMLPEKIDKESSSYEAQQDSHEKIPKIEDTRQDREKIISIDDIKKYFSDPKNDEEINSTLIKLDRAKSTLEQNNLEDYQDYESRARHADYQKVLEDCRSSLYALSALADSDPIKQEETLNDLAQNRLKSLKSAAENIHFFGFELADGMQDSYRVIEEYAKTNFPEAWDDQTIEARAKENLQRLNEEYSEFLDIANKMIDEVGGRELAKVLSGEGIMGKQAQVFYGKQENREGSWYSLFDNNKLRIRIKDPSDHCPKIYLNGLGTFFEGTPQIIDEQGESMWNLVPQRINGRNVDYWDVYGTELDYFKNLNKTTDIIKDGLRRTIATLEEYKKSKQESE